MKIKAILIMFLLFTTECSENKIESDEVSQSITKNQTKSTNSANTFYFVGIENLPEQEIAAKMIVPIFQKAGYNVEVEFLPGLRAKRNSTSGINDGEILRIYSFGENNPSLIRVPTDYSSVETTAFGLKKRNIIINTKEDLQKYKIARLRGVQTTIDLTADYSDVMDAGSVDELMRMLVLEVADIAITSDIGGISAIKKMRKSDEIVVLKVINSLPLYMYFHEKHKDVVPKFDSVIKELTANGEMKRLRRQYETEYYRQFE